MMMVCLVGGQELTTHTMSELLRRGLADCRRDVPCVTRLICGLSSATKLDSSRSYRQFERSVISDFKFVKIREFYDFVKIRLGPIGKMYCRAEVQFPD